MERLCQHLGLRRFDYIGITRLTRTHQLEVIRAAGRELGASLAREKAEV